MKNKSIIQLIFSLIFIIYIICITATNFTSAFITGEASIFVNASVSVNAPPIITISSPENKTYNYNNSIALTYEVTDQDNISKVWYNFDNSINITLHNNLGITVVGITSFNIAEGSHILYFYANDSTGLLNSKTVYFSVNTTMPYNTTTTKFAGETTNFGAMTKQQQSNITNATLHVPLYGKIRFRETINISRDLDIDKSIDVTFNRIFLNETALPEFNKNATLSIYGLTFNNPRILRNSALCNISLCAKNSYFNGTLEFNVTSFSTYSSEDYCSNGYCESGESCSSCSQDCGSCPAAPSGGGGGGGGGGAYAPLVVAKKYAFSIDKDIIKVVMRPGETAREMLKIKNTGDYALDIKIDLQNIQKYIIFSGGLAEYSFKLEIGKEQNIQLLFDLPSKTLPSVYTGSILIKGDSIEKTITVVIEVETEKPLFDVKLEIPAKFSEVLQGDELLAQVRVFSMKRIGMVDTTINYVIKNDRGEVLLEEQEMIGVETQTSFIKSFRIPTDAKEGTYVLYAVATYDHTVGTASAVFRIKEKIEMPFIRRDYVIYGIIFIIAVFLILVYYEHRRLQQIKKIAKKVDFEDLRKEKLIKPIKEAEYYY